jgi:hypothetical protein
MVTAGEQFAVIILKRSSDVFSVVLDILPSNHV